MQDRRNNIIQDQLIEKLSTSQYYFIQLDKSTDITKMVELLTFVRYKNDVSVKKRVLVL